MASGSTPEDLLCLFMHNGLVQVRWIKRNITKNPQTLADWGTIKVKRSTRRVQTLITDYMVTSMLCRARQPAFHHPLLLVRDLDHVHTHSIAHTHVSRHVCICECVPIEQSYT